MLTVELKSLSAVFAPIQVHRDSRGVRHSSTSLLALVFLGLLARIHEMAFLQRWAEIHWPLSKEASDLFAMNGPTRRRSAEPSRGKRWLNSHRLGFRRD